MLHVITTRELRGSPPSQAELDVAAAVGQVVKLKTKSRLERERDLIEADRLAFLSRRTDEILEDRQVFGALLIDMLSTPVADMAVVALRDAYREQGMCWDGISAFGDLIHSAARARAAAEWPAKLLAEAPDCSACQYGKQVRDPAGTGDSPEITDCAIECPWGKP